MVSFIVEIRMLNNIIINFSFLKELLLMIRYKLANCNRSFDIIKVTKYLMMYFIQ